MCNIILNAQNKPEFKGFIKSRYDLVISHIKLNLAKYDQANHQNEGMISQQSTINIISSSSRSLAALDKIAEEDSAFREKYIHDRDDILRDYPRLKEAYKKCKTKDNSEEALKVFTQPRKRTFGDLGETKKDIRHTESAQSIYAKQEGNYAKNNPGSLSKRIESHPTTVNRLEQEVKNSPSDEGADSMSEEIKTKKNNITSAVQKKRGEKTEVKFQNLLKKSSNASNSNSYIQ